MRKFIQQLLSITGIWLACIGSVLALPPLVNIRGEPVDSNPVLFVSSYHDAKEVLNQVPAYAGEGEGPAFFNILSVLSFE